MTTCTGSCTDSRSLPRSPAISARVSSNALMLLVSWARSVSVTAIRQASAPSYVCGSHRANPQSAAAASVVRIHSRTSAGECVVTRFITTPRATDRARSGGPTMPSEPVRSRLLSTGVPHCCSGSASSGSSATIADGIAAKPTGTLMKSSSDAARSHIRRCHVERDEQRQPAAVRRRPAPVALLTPQGENVLAERGEVGGVASPRRPPRRARGAACAGTPRPPSRSGR